MNQLTKFKAQILVPPLFYFLLALVSTWPLAGDLSNHLPLGSENAATVPLLNVWTVWWNADRLAAGYSGYWDAPIFYPAEKALAFSEPMPLSVVAAPIIWITGNRILAYNCLLILSLCLNGWVTFYVLKYLRFDWIAAWTGGVMMALLPLVHSWLGVLQLVPVFGIVLTIFCLYRFGRKPTIIRSVVLGVSFVVTYLMCAYYGLFLFILIMFAGGWLVGKKILQPKLWAALVPGMLTVMLCLPVVYAQHRATRENAFKHPERYLAELSADISDYGYAPCRRLIPLEGQDHSDMATGFKLCPGFVKTGLALIGMIWGLLSVNRRFPTLFCLTIIGASFVLSLGPNFQVGEWRPYMLLVDWVPGFAQARNVFRFSVFVHIMLTLLAAMGLQEGMELAGRHIRHSAVARASRAVIIGLGVLAIVEIIPSAQSLYALPAQDAKPAWVDWIQSQTPEESILVCLPFPLWPGIQHFEQESEWMYLQTFHHRKMLNGYSGFFPKTFLDLRIPMAGFPSPEVIDLLNDMGVNYCVVRRDSVQGVSAKAYPRVKSAFSDDSAGIDIYQLKPISLPAGFTHRE